MFSARYYASNLKHTVHTQLLAARAETTQSQHGKFTQLSTSLSCTIYNYQVR